MTLPVFIAEDKDKTKIKYSPCSFLGNVFLSNLGQVDIAIQQNQLSDWSEPLTQSSAHHVHRVRTLNFSNSISGSSTIAFHQAFSFFLIWNYFLPNNTTSFHLLVQSLSNFQRLFSSIFVKNQFLWSNETHIWLFLSWWISILIWFSVIANLIFRDRPLCIASINESFRIFQQNKKSEGLSNVNPWTNIISS